MAILFSGEKINQALSHHDEGLKAHGAQLGEVRDTLALKVDRTVFEAQLEQMGTHAAEKLEAAALELRRQLAALRERTEALEEREKSTAATIERKAEAVAVDGRHESFAGSVATLERQQQELMEALARKAEAAALQVEQRQLEAAQKRLQALEEGQKQLETDLLAKAATKQLGAQGERVDALEASLRRTGEQLSSELATKASLDQLRELERRHEGLKDELGQLARDVGGKLDEVSATLARKADVAAFDHEVRRLQEAREGLSALRELQAQQHTQVLDVLATKTDKEASMQRQQQLDRVQATCAYKEDMGKQLRRHQDQLDTTSAQLTRQHDHSIATLALKLERDEFDKQWEQVIVREIRTEIRLQREQLQEALEKKDQLIALAERMRADLTCALALRGRGPPRLGPLVPVPPAPASSHLCKSSRAASQGSTRRSTISVMVEGHVSPSPRKLRGLKSTTPE